MAFLIVDPSREARDAAASMLTWVDRRHRVDVAGDGITAISMAMQRRPSIVFVEPFLPDISGERLCIQLRQRLPNLTCVALSNESERLNGYDTQMGKPPSRLEVLSVLEQAKRNERRKKSELRKVADTRWPLMQRERKQQISGPVVTIYLSLNEDALTFGIPVAAGSTVGDVLRQIGKASVRGFTLLHKGSPLEADASAYVHAGDRMILRI